MSGRKCIVLIAEGAALPLLREWVDAGALPGFAALLGGGARGTMRAHTVPYEPPGLISAFTGVPPGEHGCYSYWAAQNPDYVPRVLGSPDVPVPFLWARPDFAGRRVAVVNLFGTHPIRPVNGSVIGYPMQQTLHASHPRTLLFDLSAQDIHIHHDVSIWYAGQERDSIAGKMVEADVERAKAALHLWRTESPDLLVLNLTSIDRTSHFYWQELEEGSPVPLERRAIFAAYRAVDAVIRDCLALVDDKTTLLAFSEIGFGPLRAFCSLNAVLEKAGFLRRRGDAVDWEATVAFEAVQGTHGVNLNRQGRNRHGCVRAEDSESVRHAVMEALRSAINPHTGAPLLKSVRPREEVYAGAALPLAPDLVVEPYDARYPPLGDPVWANHVNRTLQSGWHRPESFWALAGAGSVAGAFGDATPEAVAPTVRRALGIEPGHDAGAEALC